MNRYSFLTQLFTPAQHVALSRVSQHLLSNPDAVDTHKSAAHSAGVPPSPADTTATLTKDRPSYVR